MQINKLVSVIVPNYNHALYLNKRIDSVLHQTYQNFELIILDDCSTDNSIDIINQYKDNPRISHTVFNDINSGTPFIQWQKGFALAQGEIIWIAESDDYADERFLELLVTKLHDDNDVGVVFSDSNIVDSDNIVHKNYYKKFRNKRFNTQKWNDDYNKNGIEEIKENLFFECTINNTSAMIFKKDLLHFVDFDYLRKFKYCGDWFFFVSLLMHCNVAYLQQPLNYFKYGTDNFKKGTKSTLNYFKERFMVRYFFWNKLKYLFSLQEKSQLYKELGVEMRIQINEVIKRNSSFSGTINSFKMLYKINSNMFLRQLYTAGRLYLWKS
ncbi:MAG: glycosyltransferase family 2 protein [Janthinobacterium lividum]